MANKDETKTATTKRGKQNGYSSATLKAKRHQRQLNAEARQAVYDDLTTADKIKLAKSRRGDNKRELARLAKRLATEKIPKPTPPTKETKEAAKVAKVVKYGKNIAKSNLAPKTVTGPDYEVHG